MQTTDQRFFRIPVYSGCIPEDFRERTAHYVEPVKMPAGSALIPIAQRKSC